MGAAEFVSTACPIGMTSPEAIRFAASPSDAWANATSRIVAALSAVSVSAA